LSEGLLLAPKKTGSKMSKSRRLCKLSRSGVIAARPALLKPGTGSYTISYVVYVIYTLIRPHTVAAVLYYNITRKLAT